MAKDRVVIPGIPTDAARVIIDRMREQDERIALLERKSGRAGVVTTDTAAKPGEFLNIEAPTLGLTIILPQATQALRNDRVTLAFRNVNPVRIVSVLGLVNRETLVINTAVGVFEAICNGLDGWEVETGVSSSGLPTTATWADVLANGNTSGGKDPTISATDTLRFIALSPGINAAGDLVATSAGDMHLHPAGALHLGHTGDTNLVHIEADAEVDIVAGADILVQSVTETAIQAGTTIALSTGAVLRLTLEADGSWNIGGSNGTDGQYVRSFGAAAPPQWAGISFADLPALAGLSVLGRASSSSGVMAAITATAANQRLVSNTAGTSLEWVSDLPTTHDDTVTGALGTYILPATFRNTDTLRLTLTGNTTLGAILLDGSVTPPEGMELNLCLSDQSGGSAPGWSFDVIDAAGLTGQFRTPGQVQGTSPGPSYRMQSEEEGCRCAFQGGAWRIIGGTAAQAITGDITVAAGNGSTRDSQITAGVIVNADVNASAAIAQTKLGATTGFSVKASGSAATTSAEPIVTYSASANMSAERVLTASTSITLNTGVAGQIAPERAALTGDVTASANSNTTAIAAGVIVDADVNASAGIALSKLESIGANSIVATTTSGTVPTDIAVGTDTAVANIGEGATNTGLGAQARDDMYRWLESQGNTRTFEEDFQGNLVHHTGGESRFSVVSGLAGINLSTLSNAEWNGALELSSAAGSGTTRCVYTLGANEDALNFHWQGIRYLCIVFRTRLVTTANTHWAFGLVGPFDLYGAVTASVLGGTSEGIFVEGVTNISANIRVGRRTGSTTSINDTGVAVADDRHVYEVFRTSAGVDYHYLDGVLERTDASGIAPTGSGCTFFFSMIGSTTAERACQLDYLKVVSQTTNRFT